MNKALLIEMQLATEKKNLFVAYLALLFLGFLGVHRFYLGDSKGGVIFLGLFIGSWILSILAVPFMAVPMLGAALLMFAYGAAVALIIGWLLDFVFIPSVRDKILNERRLQLNTLHGD